MRYFTLLFLLACAVSVSHAQYVESTILLPDSVSALSGVGSMVFHAPTKIVYIGGSDSFLVAVDARTDSKLRRMTVGAGPHLLCSDPTGNKVYCANNDATVTVIDAATNQPVKTVPVQHQMTGIIYNAAEDKVYCGNAIDSLVRVIDCDADSVVAQIRVGSAPSALCYNPQLNRVCCAHKDQDEVTVIDCAADTVLAAAWVRGVEPRDICYDSATNCVYTANRGSSTVSVIDCASDTLLRVVLVGRAPSAIVTGPPGKVYCSNYGDSGLSVITESEVRTVRTVQYPGALSYDAVNQKVYCCAGESYSGVTVLDAVGDTVVAQLEVTRPAAVCWNPADNSTYVTSPNQDYVSVIGGVSDAVEAVITFTVCSPGPLCCNLANDHLYCLDRSHQLLFVVDGESNQVLKSMKTGSNPQNLIWSPASNKAYFINSGVGTVSILDCLSDSIIGNVVPGGRPRALCCSDDGKVYVAVDSGVAVIDGAGDTMRAVVSVPTSYYYASTLCYDRADKKMYFGTGSGGDTAVVRAIDTQDDSVTASITVSAPYAQELALRWNPNHDKLYVCSPYSGSVAVIDCVGDTILKSIWVTTNLVSLYNDSVCDKVQCVDNWYGYLRIINAATDTFYKSVSVGYVTALLDNGKRGPANRLYCASDDGTVAVIAGYKTDSILRRITVGEYPVALAWNPTYSRMYVSNSGSSSISVIRDTLGPGVEETMNDERRTMSGRATVVRGVLFLDGGNGDSPGEGTRPRSDATKASRMCPQREDARYRPHFPVMSRAGLLDVGGRKVMELKSGANDVSHLAPGVYFVREALVQAQARARGKPRAVQKIVLTK